MRVFILMFYACFFFYGEKLFCYFLFVMVIVWFFLEIFREVFILIIKKENYNVRLYRKRYFDCVIFSFRKNFFIIVVFEVFFLIVLNC